MGRWYIALRMRTLAVAFVVIAGCKGEKAPPPPTPAKVIDAAPPDAPNDLCELGRQALASLTTCNGKDVTQDIAQARQAFDTVVSTVRAQGGANNETACAQMLHALDEQVAAAGCLIPLSAAARTRMLDLVEAWYDTRTAVTPTGNAAADAVVQKIVAIRDAACACTTEQCLDEVGAKLGSIGGFGSDAPEVATKLGGELLDDVGRCGAKLKKPVRR